MNKRTATWLVILLVVPVTMLVRYNLRQADATSEGQVSYQSKSGNFMSFFLSELVKFGSTLSVTNTAPALPAEWRHAEDANGFQVFLPQGKKDELVRCFTQVLGEPLRRDQYPHLVYKEDRFGVGIVADLQSDPIHIICLRKGSIP